MKRLCLPTSLQTDQYQANDYFSQDDIVIDVPNTYLTENKDTLALSEVIYIQRLITLATHASSLKVVWGDEVARQATRSPSIFPLLAVLFCLDSTTHVLSNGQELEVNSAIKEIYNYKLRADLFSDVQILLCADNRGYGRPPALYTSLSGGLISREDFESIIDTLLSTHTGYGVANSKALFFIQAIATIVAELFENTEIHGRLGLDNRPVSKNGLRGIVFKRIKVKHNGEWKHENSERTSGAAPSRRDIVESDALEISVFDAGVGFYSSYTRNKLVAEVPLQQEWEVVHKCLERHYDDESPDFRPAHRAMGLYEVLRALKMVNGILEVRSGRTFGYRTFLPGELVFQLEANTSIKRPSMPKPVLLDWERKYVTKPSEHEPVVGSSLRVVVPL